MQRFDIIIIGLGGVGSATAMHLARAGKNVLGIEQFSLNHDRGSSHGQTRVIRQAYFEHTDYVPLLIRSYELWHELQQRADTRLYLQTGLLEVGPADGVVLPGVRQSAAEHQLQVDEIDRNTFDSRFAGFHLPEEMEAVFEREAGLLLVEQCVQAHLDQAREAGATLRDSESVVRWNSEGGSISVQTDRDVYVADSLVIAGGAWSGRLLTELRIRLRVLRKHMHWFATTAGAYHFDREAGQGSPAFFYEAPAGYFYGFPSIDSTGVKVCEHSGGETVVDPSQVASTIDPVDLGRVESFLSDYVPNLAGVHHDHRTCLYTMSDDEHFYVDFHPEYDNVAFAAGLSGHGFKFTPVLGELLARMTVTRSRQPEAAFLSLAR